MQSEGHGNGMNQLFLNVGKKGRGQTDERVTEMAGMASKCFFKKFT